MSAVATTALPAIAATIPLIAVPIFGFLVSLIFKNGVSKVSYNQDSSKAEDGLLLNDQAGNSAIKTVEKISSKISAGAKSFLFAEYVYMGIFIVIFAVLLLVALGLAKSWADGGFTAISFTVGSVTSIISGYIGMAIGTYANGRVALEARKGYAPAFVVAFKAGGVMGFSLTSLAVICLFVLVSLFKLFYCPDGQCTFEQSGHLYESIAGYGLGGSSIALFARVGGGIYTKAADVGADLVGKVEQGIPEDDPRNPATIADNVGDNVGDIAGMGADLFGSFAEASCAALVCASSSQAMATSWSAMSFPILISAGGIVVCAITTVYATKIRVVQTQAQIEPSLKHQLVISTLLMTPTLFGLCVGYLPAEFDLPNGVTAKNWYVFFCAGCGLWSGLLIGFITEYYTSHAYGPVVELAGACKTGAATNVIYGLALGYKSVIVPVCCLCVTIYVSFRLCGMYGIACAAIGILSTLAIGLTIDAYGPISDNAGGIAEMAGLGEDVRERTDALDAAGNTTAAIGKGFAIGSAALVSLALFGAYLTRTNIVNVDVVQPFVFAGLLFGAMVPYWFSAMTMKSVGTAALEMVEEVRRQFRTIPGLMEGNADPDYARCIKISTDASLKQMIQPGILVMGTPMVVGLVFGTHALAGLLAGSLLSSVQLAISASNTGGAWDNAKKYIESGHLGGKGSDAHHAAVCGDTVGDPLKDTSGPALNIVMKLSAVLSLVFAPFFTAVNGGNGLVSLIG